MYVNYQTACTPDQYRVVCQHDGPILCVACPGSGKTHTLVHRAAHMIQSGIDPASILLVSFTRKASHEMTERIARLIGPDAQGMWAGTFHSVALRLLRRHATLLGFDNGFSVMSQGDMTDLMRDIRSDAKQLVSDSVHLPNTGELLSFFSAVRNRCDNLNHRVDEEHHDYADTMCWMFEEYTAKKRAMGLLDYDDLLFGFQYILASKPELRAAYSKKFQYIMVDEFQDTNPVQNDIVLMLTDQHDNLMVVGDEAQSIYAFRGADISNILTIMNHFPTMTVMRLEENHRSNAHIVQLLNATLTHATEKIDKMMRPVLQGTFPPPVIQATRTALVQAEYVTDHITTLHNSGVPYQDMAVLFRNAYHANILDMFLSRQGIPFTKWGGIKFNEAAHVLDVLAFLKIRLNPRDKLSWRRVLQMLPGVGHGAMQKIFNVILPPIADEDDPFQAEIRPPVSTRPAWELLRDFQGKAKYVPALRTVGALLTDLDLYALPSGDVFDRIWGYYEPFCAKMYPKDTDFRKHGVQQLRDMAARFPSISEFLDEFATDDTDAVREDGDEPVQVVDTLTLSTIHSAKGCEWAYVFVIELVEGALPSYRNLDDEEELRLFYVACSRAKYGLYLVYPRERRTPDGRTERCVPSRFVRRIIGTL